MYKPQQPFNVRAVILKAEYRKVNGVKTKVYEDVGFFFCSAKSYGGTEKTINGEYVIEDTLQVETWYRPEITSDCKIRLMDDNSEWELVNSPEDIDRRHLYLRFKLKRIVGGA